MHRFILAGLVLISAVTVFDVPTAEAQVSSSRNPWCLRDGPAGGRGSWDCTYHNRQQCEASAFGAGGSCTPNPNYRGRQTKGQRQQQDNWGGQGNWGWGGNRW
jgi:hypothetical protein